MRWPTRITLAIFIGALLLLSAQAGNLGSSGEGASIHLPLTVPTTGPAVGPSPMSLARTTPHYTGAGLNVSGNFMPWVCQFCTWSGSESAFATEYDPYAANITELSTEMYYLSSSCTDWLCSQGYENTTNDLTPFDHTHGIKPLPMITTCTISTLQSFLGTASNWPGFISTAVAKAVYLGYGGYNIDWEPDTSCAAGTTTHANGIELAHFVDEFANASHAHGLIVTLDFAYWDTNFWNEAALAATTGDVFMEMNYQCPGTGFTDNLDADLSYFPTAHLGEALDPEEGCTDAEMVQEMGQVQAAGVTNIEWWALDDASAALDNAHLWTAVHDFVYNGASNGTTSQSYDPGSWGLNANEHPTPTGAEVNLFTLGSNESGYVTAAVRGSKPITSVTLRLSASLDPSDYRIYEGNLSTNGTVLSSWQLPITNLTLDLGPPPGTTPTTGLLFELATAPGGTLGGYLVGGSGSYAFFGVTLNGSKVGSAPTIGSFTVSPTSISLGGTAFYNVSATGGVMPYDYAYANLPTGCASSNRSSISCTPTAAGAYSTTTVTVTGQDGRSNTSASVGLVVKAPSYTDPTISSFTASADRSPVGGQVYFNVTASGGTGAGTYSYAYTGLPTGCTSTNVSSLKCTPTAAGDFSQIGVTVTDARENQATGPLLALLVYVPLSVASFSATPATISLGKPVNLSVGITGGVLPVTYTYSGFPAGCTSVNLSKLSCTPSSAGEFNLTVQVVDSIGELASRGTVLQVVPSIAPLEISSFILSPDPVAENGSVTVEVLYSGGVSPFTFAYTGLPTGCAAQNSSSFSCVPTQSGSFDVMVRVTDAQGKSATNSTDLTVTPPSSGSPPSSGGTSWLNGTTETALLLIVLVVAAALGVAISRRKRPEPIAPPPSAGWPGTPP